MSAPYPTAAKQLDVATGLMQAGQFVQARQLLEQFMRANPGVARAHWLLGGALLNSGDLTGAEHSSREAVRLDSGNASPHALLGEILAAQGRVLEAEATLRRALMLQPQHAPAATSLAKVLLDQGRSVDAHRLIGDFIRTVGETPGLLLLRAQSLLSMRDYPGAIHAFRQTIEAAPRNGAAQLGLAAALADTGRYAAAEDAVRRAMGNGQDGAQSRFVLARTLLGQQRFGEAETEFRNAIRMRPDFAQAHVNLAEMLWMCTGDTLAVVAQIDASLRIVPASTALRILKAKLLEASGSPDAALVELDSALAHAEHDSALHLSVAQIAVKCDAAHALKHAELAWKLEPEDPAALGTYGHALLAAGRADQAEAFAAKLLAVNADDGSAILLRATAWRMLGDPRYRDLYDYGQFVRPQVIDTPDGWPDLPSYLEDLARELLKLHRVRTHPIGQSLRNGTQVDLTLEYAADPAIRAFAQAVDGPIRRYMEAIGAGNDPLRRRNTGHYKLSGTWSVRLRPGGYHFNHFHPEGWLSSVCYIQIPRTLGAHGGEGWLQFGQPAFPTTPPMPPEYFVQPEQGLLVLFPSCFWHGTVPFTGGATDGRLTIAFDVIPANSEAGVPEPGSGYTFPETAL